MRHGFNARALLTNPANCQTDRMNRLEINDPGQNQGHLKAYPSLSYGNFEQSLKGLQPETKKGNYSGCPLLLLKRYNYLLAYKAGPLLI